MHSTPQAATLDAQSYCGSHNVYFVVACITKPHCFTAVVAAIVISATGAAAAAVATSDGCSYMRMQVYPGFWPNYSSIQVAAIRWTTVLQ